MGQMMVRVLQVCFVGGSLRKVGDEIMVDESTKLRTKKLPPVMEVMGMPQPTASNPSGKKRTLKFENTAED